MLRWSVIVPVKPAVRGKSRLRGATTEPHHEHLARALALDTILAALACPTVAHVLVVTDDVPLRAAFTATAHRGEPEPPAAPHREPRLPVTATVHFGAEPTTPGLNAAVRHGQALLVPTPTPRPVAALTADLPALRPTELAAALAMAAHHPRAFVPDAHGDGTVLLTATGPGGTTGPVTATGPLEPRFGPRSAILHEESGAIRLAGDWPTLRHDVDTPADLVRAHDLGLGPHTRRVLARAPSPR